MIVVFATLALQAAAPALPPAPFPNPAPDAVTLGRRLADTGTLASVLPMIAATETEDMIAEHPELSAAELAELRRVAAETLATGRERLLAGMGRAYAERLSVADLRRLVAASEDPAAARMRAVLPLVVAGAVASAEGIDFKRDTLAAFCKRTGKACTG